MSEINHNFEDGFITKFFNSNVPDLISATFIFLGIIIIFVVTIIMYRNNKGPGVKLIFYSTLGTVVSVCLNLTVKLGYLEIYSKYVTSIFEASINIILSLLFLLGGIWLYEINQSFMQGKIVTTHSLDDITR